MPNLRIRLAVADDLDVLSALAFRAKAHWGYSAAFMNACRDELTLRPEDLATKFVYVGVFDEKPIGYYTLEGIDASAMELDALFVDPQHIGHGYGRVLLQHALTTAAATGAQRLVIQSDPNAVGFYEAMGGVVVGKRASDSIPGRVLPILHLALS